jgi:hypothetical protein
MNFEVFRDKQYVGRATVLQSTPDRSVVQMPKEFMKLEPEKGGKVVNKFD